MELIFVALLLSSGYFSITDIQKSELSTLPNFVFNLLSEVNSIRDSSAKEVNSDGAMGFEST